MFNLLNADKLHKHDDLYNQAAKYAGRLWGSTILASMGGGGFLISEKYPQVATDPMFVICGGMAVAGTLAMGYNLGRLQGVDEALENRSRHELPEEP